MIYPEQSYECPVAVRTAVNFTIHNLPVSIVAHCNKHFPNESQKELEHAVSEAVVALSAAMKRGDPDKVSEKAGSAIIQLMKVIMATGHHPFVELHNASHRMKTDWPS